MKIGIISSSIREGRNSHDVAKYIESFLNEKNNITSVMIDLKEKDFPLFHERIAYMDEVPQFVKDYSNQIKEVDAVIVVAPEYNGSFPASLKNAVDVLYAEWQKKPIALSSVSSGPFAGMQCMENMSALFWRIGARVANANLPVPNVTSSFNEDGITNNKDLIDENISKILNEFSTMLG